MATMNQIKTILNAAQQQAWGKTAVSVVDTSTMIALGNYVLDSSNVASKDLWTSALTDIIGKTIFVSRGVTSPDLGITRDETDYGAVVRKVRVKPNALVDNAEYNLTEVGYDPFALVTPTVSEQLYSKHATYMAKVSILDSQLFTAFQSDTEMQNFYSLIFQQLEDSMFRAEKGYDRLAVCNYIAEKSVSQTAQPTKTHMVNLLQAYKDETNVTLTVADAWKSADFLKFFANQMLLYKEYIAVDGDSYNTSDGYVSQTPESRLKFFVLKALDAKLQTNLYADTYHKEMVTVEGYKTVPFWQGYTDGVGASFNTNAISKIVVDPASGGDTVTLTGVLAVMFDQDAIVSCYRADKAESVRVPMKGTNHMRARTHMYINDLYENGIVFYIEDLA